MYFNTKVVHFITLYLEELICMIEREFRDAVVRKNRS